jgi:hypothetical protein
MIEKLDGIQEMSTMSEMRIVLMNIMLKQDEIIKAFNAQQESKPEKTLWVNKECKVVEFCCDELKAEFKCGCSVCLHKYAAINLEEYVLRRTYRYRQWCALREEPFDSREYTKCPYCNASIKLYLTDYERIPRYTRIITALNNKEATK